MVTLKRTYPQPDSPARNIGPRERALAVFKYLLDLEPEAAKDHPLFACIVHSYEQAIARVAQAPPYTPSLVPMLTSGPIDGTKIVPMQGERL